MTNQLENIHNDNDRFKELSKNYGEYFHEVFEQQGLNYDKLQESVYDEVVKEFGDKEDISILDIGVGDGETSKLFINHGYRNIIGIDLNKNMLAVTQEKYGDQIRLMEENATNLSKFSKKEFDAFIAGTSIHNIPKAERVKFWQEILRVLPTLCVFAEKISDGNPGEYIDAYNKEIEAIKKIFTKKYNLPNIADEWIKHYIEDEKEKLTLEEIKSNLASKYTVNVVFEMGLYKTIVCRIKNQNE